MIIIRRYALLIFAIAACVFAFAYIKERGDGLLHIYFLDIGQGDAIYIRTPGGNDMLIDGGPTGSVLRRLSEVMPWYDQTIDVVLESHPDADHIGGLPEVLTRYRVGAFVEPGIESKNAIDDEIGRLREERGIERIIARRGLVIDFEDGAHFSVLFPDTDVSDFKDTNDASIVGQLIYGSTTIMLTGDSPKAVESHLLETDGALLRSDMLKAGHHGSKSASGEEYVKAVSPTYAIISAGKDNRYGHPHKEVLDIFKKLGISVYSTVFSGTLSFKSDGASIKIGGPGN
jgi:competence protein ComEC